ncbi:hypothetical protein Ade02nite_23870 [Paractinoplanes deccanensis]|uniref:Uncharacterized protein n=1 Tax=Paractinoplanes deccanensis TaxID=113561 RepID=A0ABQ3Y161_9ACTN|nr:hypothetical protein Ade02nite_23870 [Actinoplanes deccanensis]
MRDDVRDLGVAQQRLGRDAAHVEADPTPVLVLDHSNRLAELRSTNGGDISPGPGAEDKDIKMTHPASL